MARQEFSAAGRQLLKGNIKESASHAVSGAKQALGIKEKSHDQPFKMLLIGETGSGKTSFVNLLCNCGRVQALGGDFDSDKLEQFRHFNDMSLENAECHQMESKTSGAKLYNVQLSELKVGLIDTPGFGDSRGMSQDKANVKKIIATLEGEEFINCVCLIVNGRQARMSATLKYVMSEITAILPKEILNNIIVVFSNTSDPLDLNFDPTELDVFFGGNITKNIFFIENPYCRFEKAKQKRDKLPLDTIAKSLMKAFEDTAKVLDEMHVAIKDLKPVHTHRFITLFNKKEEIEISVLRILTSYDNQKRLEKGLKMAKEQVDTAFKMKNLKKDFKIVRSVEVVKVVETDRHNTLCGAKECYSNCHAPCYLDKSFEKSVFKHCASHGGSDYCKECGHHYTEHYHNEVKFETETEEKDFIDENLRKEFEAAQTQEERSRILLRKLEKRLEDSKAERERLSRKLLVTIDEFHTLGINRNYAMLIESQLRAIETRLEGTVGPEAADLKKTKEALEKKLIVVNDALKDKH